MKNAVNNDTIELICKWNTFCTGIFPDPGNADINITFHNSGVTKAKRDDIGIGVMIKVLLIDGQQILVTAENVIEVPRNCLFYSQYSLDPGRCFSGVWERKSSPLAEETNAGHSGSQEFI